ncbi:MAG: hypothetical protein LH469_06555 [Frankiaceae bacterium]|nr:hypothetical protein [Frankiaceae bacterium]
MAVKKSALDVATAIDATGHDWEVGQVAAHDDEGMTAGSGWSAPWLATALGWGSVPLLFLSPLSFVLSGCLVLAAGTTTLTVFTDEHADVPRRLVAMLGLMGGATAVALTVLPFVLQD